MIRFIDEYRNRFTIEFICTTLKNNREGGFITSRGYRQSKARGLKPRRLRDDVLVERISAVHQANYGVYGVRKMWHALRREGIDIGREHTARLMRLAGVSGKGKGRSPITTRKPNVPDLRPDLVEREFKAQGPNKLWVADITYVRTKKGFVYAAFVTDVFSRRIIGWALSDSMRTSGFAAARSQPGDPSALRKQQVLFTIRITGRSMSALSTISEVPSTALQLPPGLLVTGMTMLWLKTSTVLTRTSSSILAGGMMSSTWRLRPSSGCHGGMRTGSTRAWGTEPRLRLKTRCGNKMGPGK